MILKHLGCWSVRDSVWGTRIMCLRIQSDPKRANERNFGLEVKPTGNFIYTVDRNVIDICQVIYLHLFDVPLQGITIYLYIKAKMDSSVTCILYVTMPNQEPGSRVFLQPLAEISDICDQAFLDSPIYNAHWGTLLFDINIFTFDRLFEKLVFKLFCAIIAVNVVQEHQTAFGHVPGNQDICGSVWVWKDAV